MVVRGRKPLTLANTLSNKRRMNPMLRPCAYGLAPLAVLVQSSPTPDSGAAAAAGCIACSGILLLLSLALIALNIAILVWVARDSKARGMDSSVIWMLLVFFVGPLALIIYLFARPQGPLRRCPYCNNKRLAASAKCPHCGNS